MPVAAVADVMAAFAAFENSTLAFLLSTFPALRNRVLLLSAVNGVPLDVALGAIPFEENSVRRATPWQIAGRPALVTCSAEDLIVHKAFAARLQDWVDIERVILRQGPSLDTAQIWHELRPLVAAKEEPQILDQLQALFVAHLHA